MDSFAPPENQASYNESKHCNGNFNKYGKNVNRKRKNKNGKNFGVAKDNSTDLHHALNTPSTSVKNNGQQLNENKIIFCSRNPDKRIDSSETLDHIKTGVICSNQLELVKESKSKPSTDSISNDSGRKIISHAGKSKNFSNYDREMPGHTNDLRSGCQEKRNVSGMKTYNNKFHGSPNNSFINKSEKDFLSYNSSFQNTHGWSKNGDRNFIGKHSNCNFKRNPGFHNVLTHEHGNSQADNKNQGFSNSNPDYKFINGFRVRGNSDRLNKPQRTYVFRRTGKNNARGNTLGMFWPKVSPNKECEQHSSDYDGEIKSIQNEEKRAKFDKASPISSVSSNKLKEEFVSTDHPLITENGIKNLVETKSSNDVSSRFKEVSIAVTTNSNSEHKNNNLKSTTNLKSHDNTAQNGCKPFSNNKKISQNSLNHSSGSAKSSDNFKPSEKTNHQSDSIKEISSNLEKSVISKEKKNGRNKTEPKVKGKDGDLENPNNSKDKTGKVSDLSKNPANKNQTNKKRQKKGPNFRTYFITLDFRESFDEQAKAMIKYFEMTAGERAKIDLLRNDLYRVFSPLIPNVKPVMFGSIVAGTAFRNSDVDIYLECFDSLPMGNVRDFIIHYGSAVHKGGFFRHGIKIATARVPIVKTIHNATGKNVDISFVTETSEPHYGLSNSLLVKHLCFVDPRVRSLIMLVLFWAKSQGFVGKYQMSSFSFIMMAVFYLQVVEILPPLYKLVQEEENSQKWPITFNSNIDLLANSNTESLESLYLGFFTFYSAVRFSEVVISPFAGELVLGALFDSMEMLPDCYSLYRRLVKEGHETPLVRTSMCIQEPFNLSWNTVRSVNPRIMELLQQGCQNVCNVFSNFSSNRALYVIHSGYYYSDGEDDSYTWEIPCPPGTESLEWFQKVLRATQAIFNKILLMEVERKYSDSPDVQESQFCIIYLPDADEENPVKLNIWCEYLVGVKDRSKVVKAYQAKYNSELEQEIKASSLFLEILKKKDKKSRFSATVYIARNEKSGSAEVTINKCSNRNKWKRDAHNHFVSYLKADAFTHFLKLTLLNDHMDKQIESASKKED